MEILAKKQGWQKKPWTATKALPGGENIHNFEDFQNTCLQQYAFLASDYIKRLCRYYGNSVHDILAQVKSAADLGEAFAADLYHHEVDYLLQHEFAKNAADILWRRTKIGLYASQEDIVKLEQYVSQKNLSQPS
jgi:glycerol-3-phosphate dehydrogenase